MRAESEDELACHAREYEFEGAGGKTRHGVVSYFAATTLPRPATVQEWLCLIAAASAGDVARGALPATHMPVLQVVGDPLISLPGAAAPAP
jgi:hypothetical protein